MHPTKALILTSSLALVSSPALASGFFLHEQSAALLGGFYSGSAAIAEDATTNWYNSAGLTHLKGGNFVITATNVSTQTEFHGTTTLTSEVPFPPFVLENVETGKVSGGTARLIPAIHGAYRINDKFAVGLSVVTPFGLSTNYGEDSIARYNATESEIKTIDISPSVAYKPWEWFSIGVGFDAEYAEAKIDSIIGVADLSLDSLSKNKANNWGYGWHLGVLAIVPSTQTHLGLNFHSNIEQNLSGRSKLHGPLNPLGYESNDLTGSVDLPWWLVGSLTQDLGDYFTALFSVEYVHWSSIEKLELKGVETGGAAGATVTSTDELNYRDTWGFFGALRLKMSDNFMLTVGGGYEDTPTNDTDRDLRLPDANRWIASAGLRYVPELAPRCQLDLGYAHLWGQEVPIDKITPATTQVVTAVGEDRSQVNLLGLQLTVKI